MYVQKWQAPYPSGYVPYISQIGQIGYRIFDIAPSSVNRALQLELQQILPNCVVSLKYGICSLGQWTLLYQILQLWQSQVQKVTMAQKSQVCLYCYRYFRDFVIAENDFLREQVLLFVKVNATLSILVCKKSSSDNARIIWINGKFFFCWQLYFW